MKNGIFRPVTPRDLDAICEFPQNELELFSSFPAAKYPLTVEQLKNILHERKASSVIELNDEVVGYANLYNLVDGDYCFIGNVFISAEYRQQGLGECLIRRMMKLAFDDYGLQSVRVSCFSFNEKALSIYKRIGFVEYDVEIRQSPSAGEVELFHLQYDIFRFVKDVKKGLFKT